MGLVSGTRLGSCEIVALIGSGGMGEVYQARDTRLDRIVTLKVITGGGADDSELRTRFEREARAISSLNHPNICVLHEIGRGTVCYDSGSEVFCQAADGSGEGQALFKVDGLMKFEELKARVTRAGQQK
jgi:serine/threonine protein kinase